MENIDPSSGKKYYVNMKTSTLSWTWPDGVPATPSTQRTDGGQNREELLVRVRKAYEDDTDVFEAIERAQKALACGDKLLSSAVQVNDQTNSTRSAAEERLRLEAQNLCTQLAKLDDKQAKGVVLPDFGETLQFGLHMKAPPEETLDDDARRVFIDEKLKAQTRNLLSSLTSAATGFSSWAASALSKSSENCGILICYSAFYLTMQSLVDMGKAVNLEAAAKLEVVLLRAPLAEHSDAMRLEDVVDLYAQVLAAVDTGDELPPYHVKKGKGRWKDVSPSHRLMHSVLDEWVHQGLGTFKLFCCRKYAATDSSTAKISWASGLAGRDSVEWIIDIGGDGSIKLLKGLSAEPVAEVVGTDISGTGAALSAAIQGVLTSHSIEVSDVSIGMTGKWRPGVQAHANRDAVFKTLSESFPRVSLVSMELERQWEALAVRNAAACLLPAQIFNAKSCVLLCAGSGSSSTQLCGYMREEKVALTSSGGSDAENAENKDGQSEEDVAKILTATTCNLLQFCLDVSMLRLSSKASKTPDDLVDMKQPISPVGGSALSAARELKQTPAR